MVQKTIQYFVNRHDTKTHWQVSFRSKSDEEFLRHANRLVRPLENVAGAQDAEFQDRSSVTAFWYKRLICRSRRTSANGLRYFEHEHRCLTSQVLQNFSQIIGDERFFFFLFPIFALKMSAQWWYALIPLSAPIKSFLVFNVVRVLF